MRSITVREAQHNLAEVLRTVERGEVVEIRRRNKPLARIVPLEDPAESPSPIDWGSHERQMSAVWAQSVIEDVDDVLSDLRGNR